MKVTLIRQDNGSGKETLSVCEAGTLFDKMKTETKAGHITALRGIIPLLEGTYARYEHIDKLPYIYSAVEYTRTKEGERKMKRYNGLVQLEVSRLAGGSEAEFVKRQAALLPQTFAAFCGSYGDANDDDWKDNAELDPDAASGQQLLIETEAAGRISAFTSADYSVKLGDRIGLSFAVEKMHPFDAQGNRLG